MVFPSVETYPPCHQAPLLFLGMKEGFSCVLFFSRYDGTMKIPALSLTKRNQPLLMAAVACDAARRVCEAVGRKEMGVWLRGARVVAGKVTFLTGRSVVNHELALLSNQITIELARVMTIFYPSQSVWKVFFV